MEHVELDKYKAQMILSKEQRIRWSGLSILRYVSLVILAAAFIFPFLYALYNSFLPLKYVDQIVGPENFSLNNYFTLFKEFPVARWLLNSTMITFITVSGNVLFDSMAGYAFAKLHFPGRNVMFFIVLITMMIPFQLVLAPLYIMIAKMHWHNTMAGLTIPFLYQAIYIFMIRQFFMTIPDELIEAAKIDGLGRIGTYFKIMLPLSGPVLASVVIFNFTTTWNAYMVPATFTSTKEMYPLVVGLNTVKDLYFDRTNLTMAGVILLSLPVTMIFLCFQRYFVQGIAATGIKG